MIVAMVPVGMMEMTIDQVVDMIALRNSFVSATFSMDVALVVSATLMVRRATIGIFFCNLDHVFVHVIPVGMI
ncbi:hypothetical protein HYPP_02704 [Hyphomicrobium sp. ghe19]|nr:hypothetical protein HYPP_02704 [Hyphomicrobium sp. ghe19]